MADDITTLSIGVSARLDQFRKDMAQIPGIGAAEARDLATGIRKSLNEATKASQAATAAATAHSKVAQASFKATGAAGAVAAKTVQGAWAQAAKSLQQNQLVSQLETVSSMFAQVGGTVAQVSILTSSAIRPVALLASTLGGATVAMAGLPLAGLAAIKVMHMIGENAQAAAERLTKLGRQGEIPRETRDSLETYRIVTQELTVQMDLLAVSMGSRFIPALTRAAAVMTIATDPAKVLSGALAEMGDNGRMLTDVMESLATKAERVTKPMQRTFEILVTGGGILALEAFSGTIGKVADEATREAEALERARRELEDFVAQAIRETQAEEDRRRASAKAGDQQLKTTKAIKGTSDADREASRIAREVRDALLRDNEAILASEETRRQAILALAAAQRASRVEAEQINAEMAEMGEIVSIALIRNTRETEAYAGSWQQVKDIIAEVDEVALGALASIAGSFESIFGTLLDRTTGALDEIIAKENELRDRQVEIADELREIREADADDRTLIEINSGKDREAALQQERDANAEKLELLHKQEIATQQAAIRTFRAQQVAAAAQVAIQAALAYITAFAQVGPIGWPFAAAAITTATGAALVAIAAQEPPSAALPTGLVPGHGPDHSMSATIQPGEGVTSDRATQALGGAAGLAALNAGIVPTGGVTQIYLGRRVIAEAINLSTASRPVDPRRGQSTGRKK